MMQSISTHFRLLLKHRDKQNSRNVQISDLMTAIMSAILDFENTFVPPHEDYIVQNLVGIGPVILILWQFKYIACLA